MTLSEKLRDDRPMTCGEVATYFEVSQRTVDRWAAEEGMPVHRVGGGQKPRKRYYRSELDTWARSRCSDQIESGAGGAA